MASNGNISHVETILNFLEKFKKFGPSFVLDGKSVTIADAARVACMDFYRSNVEVKISEEARKNLRENAAYLDECLEKKMIVYGVNTGFGGSADVRNEDILAIQKALVFHLNCGSMSEKLDVGHVRAAMLIRANSLSRAYSGVRPEVVDLLCQMINKDIVPQVPLRGSVSASGDLLHLSYITACMSGNKRKELVYHRGKLDSSAEEVFQRNGLEFIEFRAKEALAVTNAASCASTLAALNLFDFGTCLLLVEIITSMSVECLKGRMESFHQTVCNSLPHAGMREFSGVIRKLLEKSQLARHDLEKLSLNPKELAQDRYALRTSPQWMSPSIETFKDSVRRVTVELNSSNDNPLIDHVEKNILHCGNFQGSSTTVAMDQTRQSVQMCGRMIFAQLSEVLNHHMNGGLPPNLSGCDYTKDFGFKGLDTSLAAYTSELEFLAGPMTNHVMSAEMHNQSINSMALVSARKTSETLDLLRLIMASSFLSLCQALDLRWLQSQITRVWHETTKEVLGFEVSIETQEWLWYDAAFRFDFVRAQLEGGRFKSHHVNGQVVDNNKVETLFLEKFEKRIKELLESLYGGSHVGEVSDSLGLGTRKMYLFFRKELNARFYNGTETLDHPLERILKAIRGEQMMDLLLDIFDF